MKDRIPRNWVEASVSDLFRMIGGGTPNTGRPEYWSGHTPWITSADISENHRVAPRRCISEAGIANSTTNKVPPGTLIVAVRVGVGKTAVAESEMCFSQDCQGLVPRDRSLYARFFMYQTEATVEQLVRQGRGTTISGLTKAALGGFKFRLAPTREQCRVVEAIESYLTRLDDAMASLERVQRNLERYRASALEAAVGGRLVSTEAELARREGREYEPASEPLKRILAERKRRWIEDAAEKARARAEEKARRAGKPWTPEDDAQALQKARKDVEAKYKEPAPPDTTNLPDLPEGWCWAGPEQLAAEEDYALGIGPFGSDLLVSDYRDRGVPLIFVRNIRSGRFGIPEDRFVSWEKAVELRPHRVEPGDVLITKMGEPPGDACLYPANRPSAVVTADCIRLRPNRAVLAPEYAVYAFRTRLVRQQVVTITRGVAQKKVSLGRFKSVALPLPPLSEQLRIVLRLNRIEDSCVVVERQVRSAVLQGQQLRQSVLRWAFEGKIVEQDPKDEPASALLERIKAECEKLNAGTGGKRGKRRCKS